MNGEAFTTRTRTFKAAPHKHSCGMRQLCVLNNPNLLPTSIVAELRAVCSNYVYHYKATLEIHLIAYEL